MHEATRGTSKLLAVVGLATSPMVAMGTIFALSLYALAVIQNKTGAAIKTLAIEVNCLNDEQSRLDSTHGALMKAIGDLEEDAKLQMGRLRAVNRFARERDLVIGGIPESDGENLEVLVRELFSKKLSLNFEETEMENVKRTGKKVEIVHDGQIVQTRKTLVRFLHLHSKIKVLEKSRYLDGTGYVVQDDDHDISLES
ncbi:uncharacterized protein LOC143468554 [Clavelina lepadiformis]|uniref:Uncharacterized protein n=1 Tax=Clavelina lepadiformis TaxID=159417 RepID=A0ABP0F3K9_CLALP